LPRFYQRNQCSPVPASFIVEGNWLAAIPDQMAIAATSKTELRADLR
jgi:hypothetical protein